MSIWNDEMNQMLAVFERQAKVSLGNIETAFERSGLSLNDKFKQYFLRASYNRLEETYDQFELTSMLNKRCNYDTTGSTSTPDEWPITNTTQTRSYDTIETIDSSDDEGDQPGYRMKLELLEELAAIQNNDDHDMTSELNDVDHFANDDESDYTEVLPYSNGYNESEKNDALKTNGMVVDDENSMIVAGEFCDIVELNKYTTMTASSNEQYKNDSVKINNLTARSNGQSTKIGNLRSTPQLLLREKSTSSKQLEKKRFKCELCEYASHSKWFIHRHMRTHTGEKPYRCDICHRQFSEKHKMRMHKMIHSEIPFHCRGCFGGFSQKAEIDAHEKVCKNRRYECHICKKFVTSNKCKLQSHMTKHSGEKPFQCEICMKRFTTKCSLKRHLNTIHTRINTPMN